MAIVSYTEKEIRKMIRRGEDKTDWKRIRKMRDEDIVYDEDSPKTTDAELKLFRRVGRPAKDDKKENISIRLDSDVLAKLRKKKNWQTDVNALLRKFCGLA
ncbi:MAG: BrnA antitoxin family protein [Proteobacteria bacterium]|nr:BrnA antitoxin family protein [Pseudomonadota bacterium]